MSQIFIFFMSKAVGFLFSPSRHLFVNRSAPCALQVCRQLRFRVCGAAVNMRRHHRSHTSLAHRLSRKPLPRWGTWRESLKLGAASPRNDSENYHLIKIHHPIFHSSPSFFFSRLRQHSQSTTNASMCVWVLYDHPPHGPWCTHTTTAFGEMWTCYGSRLKGKSGMGVFGGNF